MTSPPGPQKMPMQNVANRIVRGLLATPGLHRVVSGRLITLYLVGRKSGRRYTLPVAYSRVDSSLLIGTPFAWSRNLRSGGRVELRLQGSRRTADVEAFTEEADVVAHYATLCRDNPQFAKFNEIELDVHGNPSETDLHTAWRAGARSFRLTPH
ncbi:hypothetical protein VX037_06725 [Gordonia sp. Z-3]|uniref:hypothetical protein n=1 Tax=Gordonia sp. Z-3 TaxID=3115408 RepID=UPI002E296BD9|nr:hypothetical protein [Gordonia sp. Z-3]MED5800720.1 hypothetical protein [Gordonia sp. Z-3]